MARKSVIEQIKMLCMSNKTEITEIKFTSTNVQKMIINWAFYAAFSIFLFLFIRKKILVIKWNICFCKHSVLQYTITHLIFFPSQS